MTSARLISVEITPFRQLIALVEAKQNGENQFILMAELPEAPYDDEKSDNLSFYPLEKTQNSFYKIHRFRANPSRTLVGLIQDVDSLGIVPIIPEWQLNEFDDLETEGKLSVRINSSGNVGCQIIDYTFDSWKNLNPKDESENSIVAETIYMSGKSFFLKQLLTINGQSHEQMVELPPELKSIDEPHLSTLISPVAVATSSNTEETCFHFVWVLSLCTKALSQRPHGNPSSLKGSIYSLNVRGWQCVKENEEYKLDELKITGNSHNMKLSLSLGSAIQLGLDTRMVTVGSSHPQDLSTSPVRLVACMGWLGKCFILALKRTPGTDKTWELQGVELELPKPPSATEALSSNYKLRVTSTFLPRNLSGGIYQDPEDSQQDQDEHFEKLDYRVGLYDQQNTHDVQLVFKAAISQTGDR